MVGWTQYAVKQWAKVHAAQKQKESATAVDRTILGYIVAGLMITAMTTIFPSKNTLTDAS
jgi:hypothetical protein